VEQFWKSLLQFIRAGGNDNCWQLCPSGCVPSTLDPIGGSKQGTSYSWFKVLVCVVAFYLAQAAAFATAPTATTQAASSITTSSAQLNCYVNPNALSTTIYYQYGLTASYGSTTISGNIGTSAGNYGISISGLSANTTYHFRIVALTFWR
jgi:hypothetical protein